MLGEGQRSLARTRSLWHGCISGKRRGGSLKIISPILNASDWRCKLSILQNIFVPIMQLVCLFNILYDTLTCLLSLSLPHFVPLCQMSATPSSYICYRVQNIMVNNIKRVTHRQTDGHGLIRLKNICTHCGNFDLTHSLPRFRTMSAKCASNKHEEVCAEHPEEHINLCKIASRKFPQNSMLDLQARGI